MGFFDTLLGKDASEASNAAAADQYRKQREAAGATSAAGNSYLESLLGLSTKYDPYVSGGNAALTRLMQGLGLTPGGSEAFTNAYRASPGYQSGLDTGTRAVTSRLNAGPGIQSGAAMKALQRYGSDYEDQRSGDYLNRLAGMSTQGLGATQSQVGTASQGYQGKLGADMASAGQLYGAAPTIGQGMVAGANAESQGLGNTIKLGMSGLGMLMGMPGGAGAGFGSSFTGNTSNPFAGTPGATTSYYGGTPYPMFR